MPRPKGSRVIFCKSCHGRIVGMPGERKACPYCNKWHVMPRPEAKGKKKKH